MQDRYYIIAIVVILAICCLGGYVALSGYLNSNPPSVSFRTPGVLATPLVVLVSTDTPGPAKSATPVVGAPTALPVPSPLGAFQTIAASTTQLPPTPKPVSVSPTVQPTLAALSCIGFAFCAKGGPPDGSLGPGGADCPRNYIWGRVVDRTGNGMPNVRIRYKLVSEGDVTDAFTKAPPDPAGIYNIPTGQPGSVWLVWIVDAGNQVSPQVPLTTRAYPGSGDCPTRIDFVQK